MENISVTYDSKYKSSLKKVLTYLQPERSFYFASFVYGAGVSVLTLAIPISVQALVNTVNFGTLTQPLLVLSVVLFLLLFLSGILKALQTYVIELFQRRFYTRTTSEIVKNILQANAQSFKRVNGVELTNRYFDIMTVQKKVTTLLMDTIAVILQTFVGLILLGFYHPYFLVFDLILIVSLWAVWKIFGKNAVLSAIEESKKKYKVAGWIQEISRENLFFKSSQRRDEAARVSDNLIVQYIDKRKKHFKYLFGQHIFFLIVYAFMSSLILGLGGYLALQGQLTIGQLVAAELIITVILASIAKSAKYLESFYDLTAAVDKISELYHLEKEKKPIKKIQNLESYDLKFDEVTFQSGRYQFNFNQLFKQGGKYLLNSHYNSAKYLFIDLLLGTNDSHTGDILIGNTSIEHIGSLDVRDLIYVLRSPVVYQGTIRENLTIGCPGITDQKIKETLALVDLAHLADVFEDGLDTQMIPSGYPLWPSQLIRLEIVKAILFKPKIFILTEVFSQLELKRRIKILDYLKNSDMTIIVFNSGEYEAYNFEYVEFNRQNLAPSSESGGSI